jgi:hypothetical protein
MDLTSCRSLGFSAAGPVPWLAVNEYVRKHQLSDEQEEALHYHVKEMDVVWSKHAIRKQKEAQGSG